MRRILLAVTLCLGVMPAFAGTPDFGVSCLVPGTCQADFRAVTEDITAAAGYKALGPAESTGITGFGVGAYGAYSPTQNKDAWQNLTGTSVSGVGVAGVALHKGLPFGFDVGATYAAVPGTSARLWGVELRYAILDGGVAEPAIAVRAAYTGSTGIDDFKFNSTSIDASISKGFAILTPYAGAGWVRGKADPDASTGLKEETVNKAKFFAGMRVSFVIFELTPEYERVGDNNSYNLRLGFSF